MIQQKSKLEDSIDRESETNAPVETLEQKMKKVSKHVESDDLHLKELAKRVQEDDRKH